MNAPGSRLRVAFAGTPAFAVKALDAIADSRHELVQVFTQPDRPAGRGRRLSPSPVAVRAGERGLPVARPERFDEMAHRQLRDCGADILVVVAYGLILPQTALDIPRLGAVNIHASLLPRWRGAAPIQRAIEAGDARTGVTIMQMDAGLDTGPILLSRAVEIGSDTTAGQLHDTLAALGATLVVEALDRLAAGQLPATPQAAGACYANKLNKQEARIRWQEPAAIIERRIRAFNPVPACWTLADGERLRVHAAALTGQPSDAEPGALREVDDRICVATGDQWLALRTLQRPGGRPVAAEDWWRNGGRRVQRLD